MSEWVELRVLESKARDANRPVVRIDPEAMERGGIVVGDVVEIVGRRKTAAKVWNGLPEDRGKGVIRMNSILRKNADVSLNETVKVRKVEPKPAAFIKLAPVSMTIAVDANFLQYIKQRLREYVVVEGDMMQIYVLSQPRPEVRRRDVDYPVETAWPQQRGVHQIWAVRRRYHNHVFKSLHAVHLSQ